MNLNPVSISLSSFGADQVRQQGQFAFIALVAAAGASRIELREELLTHESLTAFAPAIASERLECLYSTPLELWRLDSPQPNAQLQAVLQRAAVTGAQWLKVSLGSYHGSCDLSALGQLLISQPVRLLVENDQTDPGGKIQPFCEFFSRVETLALPIGMTFDIGNWHWQEQSALSAARLLGRHVEYVHFKAVARNAADTLIAIPPQPSDLPAWRELLGYMPAGVTRAIEYPLQGEDLLDVTRWQVSLLAALAPCEISLQQEHSHA